MHAAECWCPSAEPRTTGRSKTVCICHDIERGLGHVDADPAFARRAEQNARRAIWRRCGRSKPRPACEGDLLRRRLAAVGGPGWPSRATGTHWRSTPSTTGSDRDQLQRCREVDYRIKGYRPPRSADHRGAHRQRTCSSTTSSGWRARRGPSASRSPQMRAGLVRLPIALDDFPMYTGPVRYEEWEQPGARSRSQRATSPRSAFTTATRHWLPRYRRFLEQLQEIGRAADAGRGRGRGHPVQRGLGALGVAR